MLFTNCEITWLYSNHSDKFLRSTPLITAISPVIAMLERGVTLFRAPYYVGHLGMGYALAGRLDDANCLLNELADRASRGE